MENVVPPVAASGPKLMLVIPSITSYFTFLEDICGELTRLGWEVHVVTSDRHITDIKCYQRPVVGKVHTVRIPRGMNIREHWRAAGELVRLAGAINPDLIHVHFSSAVFTAALGRLGRFAPLHGTVHGVNSVQSDGGWKWMLLMAEWWAFRRLDRLYVLNPSDEIYARKWRLAKWVRAYQSLGIGCRTDEFDPVKVSPARRSQLRTELGISSTTFVFIFIGRRTQFKGFAATARAFLLFHEHQPDSRLILVGERDPLHPTGLSEAEEGAVGGSLGVIDVGWCENVCDYLGVSHVNIFPSEREGMPVNLMESLAMGVPVITIDSRGCRDVVRHNIDGIVLPEVKRLHELRIETLVGAMKRLYVDRAEWRSMSMKALERRAEFSRAIWMTEQIQIYAKSVGEPRTLVEGVGK